MQVVDKQPIPLNATILKWARREAGLTLEDAAKRAGITSPRRRKGDERAVTPSERLKAWEEGEEVPSLAQLEAVAAAYRRPLTTFFLASPPVKQTNLADFRTIASHAAAQDSPEFAAFKRRLEARHAELREILILEGQQKLVFVGSGQGITSPQPLIKLLRHALNFQFDEQKKLDDGDHVLRVLRERAQQLGVFVLIEGDLGSHHTAIAADEFRGIAIADSIAPLVVINANDTKAARLFTLIHELTHIWLGESGISNLNVFEKTKACQANKQTEKLCNLVAAEFLVPESALNDAMRSAKRDDAWDIVDDLAKDFKVSRDVIARRLLDCNYITSSNYEAIANRLHAIWRSIKIKQKASGSGPSRNTLDRFRLGERMLNTVTSAAFDGKISLQEAARILRVPVSRFDKVLYATHN